MGISSNQARFLSLTSRQVDLEQRVQQICQRRLRLSSELEKVATQYNNSIGNRKMFVPQTSGLQNLSVDSLSAIGFKLLNKASGSIVTGVGASSWSPKIAEASMPVGYTAVHDVTELQAAITGDPAGNYMLMGNIDLSSLSAPLAANFSGTFDGNGYTMSGLNISGGSFSGLFGNINGGTVKNLEINNASVTSTGNYNGILAGSVGASTIDNVHITGISSVTGFNNTGGLVGYADGASIIKDSDSSANVTGSDYVGGFVGQNRAAISGSYATGDVSGSAPNAWIGGFLGSNSATTIITNSYATGNVTAIGSFAQTGGFIGYNNGAGISSCYAANGTITGTGVLTTGGFVGQNSVGSVGNTNFYSNNYTADGLGGGAVDGDVVAHPDWSSEPSWNLSGALPSLVRPTYTGAITPETPEAIEQKIRSGEYSLIRGADEFTQSPLTIDGEDYEETDWRTIPGLNDDLYKSDDVDAEGKYDKTISEINSQDKKLQLEQSSIEVEYKAISSEKDAVKKILDTNAGSSFKYFS